jgi:hypothetical protein
MHRGTPHQALTTAACAAVSSAIVTVMISSAASDCTDRRGWSPDASAGCPSRHTTVTVTRSTVTPASAATFAAYASTSNAMGQPCDAETAIVARICCSAEARSTTFTTTGELNATVRPQMCTRATCSPSHPRDPASGLQPSAQRAPLSPVHDVAPCDGSSQSTRHADEHRAESHTSPTPLRLASDWSELASSRQLSLNDGKRDEHGHQRNKHAASARQQHTCAYHTSPIRSPSTSSCAGLNLQHIRHTLSSSVTSPTRTRGAASRHS